MNFLPNFSDLLNLLSRQGWDLPTVEFCETLDVLGVPGSRDCHSSRAYRPKQQHLRLADGLAVLCRDARCDTRNNRPEGAAARGMAEDGTQRAIGYRTDPVCGMNIENGLEVVQNEGVVFQFYREVAWVSTRRNISNKGQTVVVD